MINKLPIISSSLVIIDYNIARHSLGAKVNAYQFPLYLVLNKMLQISDVKYAMQFNERCKRGQRVIALKMIADFYNSNIGRVKGFKGYLLRESLKDPPSIINITFWDEKEDMDSYYNGMNYSEFLKKIKPLLEQLPEKNEYRVFDFRLS